MLDPLVSVSVRPLKVVETSGAIRCLFRVTATFALSYRPNSNVTVQTSPAVGELQFS